MATKFVGITVLILGMVVAVFSIAAYREFRAAATSEIAPAADSLPLTELIYPDLFVKAETSAKPAELAREVINRIYAIGGLALLLVAVGFILLGQSHRVPLAEDGE